MSTRKVILFRGYCDIYRRECLNNNYQPIFIDPLQFVFVNETELGLKLVQPDYDGLILTSPRAIDAVTERWDSEKQALWRDKKIYTVGPISGERITRNLQLIPRGMVTGNSEQLANMIGAENLSGRFLFPCGNLTSEVLITTLREKGLDIDGICVYNTDENNELRDNLIELCRSSSCPYAMVFFSPSGFEYVHSQLRTIGTQLNSVPHFAIGIRTAARIESTGLDVSGVAEHPTSRYVIAAIKKFFETSNGHD